MALDCWLTIVRLRLRSLWHGPQLDRDLDEELRDHLRRLTALTSPAAWRPTRAAAALLAMAGIEQQKETCRDTSTHFILAARE